MNKLIIIGTTLLTAVAAVAMPTKKELSEAKHIVEDVTAAEIKALKAGEATAKDVADKHMSLAEIAENDAERYLLLQGAFRLYARSEEYEMAADALVTLNQNVGDVPPELIVEIVSKEMGRVAGEKAPKLLAIFKAAKRASRYRRELVAVEKQLKGDPEDPALNLKHAECLAELGNWPSALAAFAKSGGAVAKMAADESAGKVKSQTAADFWWNYGGRDEISAYRRHAADLYEKALADSGFTGLARERAETRLDEVRSMAWCTVCGVTKAVKTQEEPVTKTVKVPEEPKNRTVVGVQPAAEAKRKPRNSSSKTAAVQVESGKTYESLAAAFADSNGKTVKLNKDLSGSNFTLPSGITVTLDLNGCAIEGVSGGAVLTIEKKASLTLVDSSRDQSGMITMAPETDGKWGAVHNDGSFIMRGGIIEKCRAVNGGALLNRGTAVIDGGVIRDCTAEWGGGIYNAGELAINNGMIVNCTSRNGSAIRFRSGSCRITGGKIGGDFRHDGGGNPLISGGEFSVAPPAEILAPDVVVEKGPSSEFPYRVCGKNNRQGKSVK